MSPAAPRGHGRFAYSGIRDRPPLRWPGGARLAVYVGFNIEHFGFGEGLGANIAPPSPPPNVLNHSWREYGNRVGVWRCLELFDELALPTGALINTALYEHCPEVVQAFAARGDELIAHGHTNAERQGTLAAADERALRHLRRALRHIVDHRGAAGGGDVWITTPGAIVDAFIDAMPNGS